MKKKVDNFGEKKKKRKRKSMWGMEKKKNMYILFPIMIIN
jgi:hypothetical protein